MSLIRIGSDPEVFLKSKVDGRLVSSIGIIPGSKHRPFKTANGSVQPDNITAEFNSNPSSIASEFVANHKAIMADLESIIKPYELELLILSSVVAPKSILNHPDAVRAGCQPDFNVWEERDNATPMLVGGLRGAGGHLHISFPQVEGRSDRESIRLRCDYVKGCDMILGVPSVIIDRDKRRKKLYGKAGAARLKFKDYHGYDGVEYRTLSNFWLASDELMSWAFNSAKRVGDNLELISKVAKDNGETLVDIINNGSVSKAKNFIKANYEIYEGLLEEVLCVQ